MQRVKENDKKVREAKTTGQKVVLKRQPEQPREAKKVSLTAIKPEFLTPLPYEFIA